MWYCTLLVYQRSLINSEANDASIAEGVTGMGRHSISPRLRAEPGEVVGELPKMGSRAKLRASSKERACGYPTLPGALHPPSRPPPRRRAR